MLRKPTLTEKRYMASCNIQKPTEWLVQSNNIDGLTIVNKVTGQKTILVRERRVKA